MKEHHQNNDIVIPVMGPTGVGKSTFIGNVLNYLGCPQEIDVSDGFESCTQDLRTYRAPLKHEITQRFGVEEGSRLVLVDTPGFDSTEKSDTEILRRIADWLASAYSTNMKVGGVVYIYPIYPGRITRNDNANVKIFRKMCGEKGLERVILATTRWDICPPDAGVSREREISSSFWGTKTDPSHLPTMARLHNSTESAWSIVETVLAKLEKHGVVLALQRQLVDQGQTLRQTDAAKELRAKILQLLEESAGDPRNPKRMERLEALAREAKELKVPLSQRVQAFFGVCGK